jgi:hypothetical protein
MPIFLYLNYEQFYSSHHVVYLFNYGGLVFILCIAFHVQQSKNQVLSRRELM